MNISVVVLFFIITTSSVISLQSSALSSHRGFMKSRTNLKTVLNYRGGDSLFGKTETIITKSSTALVSVLPRISTGALLTVISVLCASAGRGIFATFVTLTSILGHKEFGSLVNHGGLSSNIIVQAALSSIILFATCIRPDYHEHMLPTGIIALVVYFLSYKRYLATVSEVSTTVFGIIYFGYLPSWWIRLHALGDSDPLLNQLFSRPTASAGAALVLWTWLSIACADSGAYAVGKLIGSHKLSVVSDVMSLASPGKTIEGAAGGVLSSVLLNTWGAHRMQWPLWKISGPLYGLAIAAAAFFGDLLESLIKRGAGVKDSGSLLPGHGGVMDRMDSLMLTAPVAYMFWKAILPYLAKRFATERVHDRACTSCL
jgi:phosphatidate cytidylyltransferase